MFEGGTTSPAVQGRAWKYIDFARQWNMACMRASTMPPPSLPRALHALGAAARGFWRDDGPSWAAAIAYYSLLSLIPLLLLLAAIAALFVDPQWVVAQATHYLGGYLPHGRAPIDDTVRHALAVARSRGWLFALPLLWTGSLVFGALDRAINVALDRPGRAGFLRRLALRLAMLVVLTALFAIALMAPLLLQYIVSRWMPAAAAGSWAIGVPLALLPAALLWLALLLAYRFVPRESPPWRRAVRGAAVATARFYLVRPLFVGYVERLGHYSVVYGSLAGIVVAMLWSWLFSMIVLYGGQIAAPRR
jgi:membrane protein